MKLNLEEMREIARTLPIGYYLGRKVPVFVEEGQHAYCDMVKCHVHIGVGLLQTAADKIGEDDADEWDRETLLRCLLYHEIGHCLMTAKWMCTVGVKKPDGSYYDPKEAHYIQNTFEDERLERTLSRYFMGVKFRKFVELVHKDVNLGDESDHVKLFKAIRLRQCSAEVSAAIDQAIYDLREQCSATPYDDYRPNPSGGYDYLNHIFDYVTTLNNLVKTILEAKQEEPPKTGQQSEQPQPQPQSSDAESEPDDGESDADGQSGQAPDEPKPDESDESEHEDGESGGDDESDDGKSEDDSDAEENSKSEENSGGEGEGDGDQGESEPDEDSDGDADGDGDAKDADSDAEETEIESDEACDDAESHGDGVTVLASLPDDYLKKIASRVFATPSADVDNALNRFAQRLAKQKGAQAAGRWSALSGRIDPRRDAMGNERIFRRSSDVGDRMNTAIHLTLWVDCSSSFCESQPILNQILSATARAADMSGGRLDVDVVHMDVVATVAERDKWQIVADGDNSINVTYYRAWKATRRKDRRNIDVVVFDGKACVRKLVDVPGTNTPIVKAIWDDHDCHLIIDNSNEFWGKLLKKAHVTYMGEGYAEALQGEVIKLLDRIL